MNLAVAQRIKMFETKMLRDHPGETPAETHRERTNHGGGEMDKGDEPETKFLQVPPLPMGVDDDETVGNKAPVTPGHKRC